MERIESEDGWIRWSNGSGGNNCVEVNFGGERIGVRNSKDRTKKVVTFTRAEWASFVQGCRAGAFDL